MNADAFRHLYDYHFAENRKLWDRYISQLTDEQFAQPVAYSHGSVHDQIVHLMEVDNAWFGDLRGEHPASPEPTDPPDRQAIRTRWDVVEQRMRHYLGALEDGMLLGRPIAEGEDKELFLWQILLHVVNHGTDHRAQLLRALNDLGIETRYQDYIFYAYEFPVSITE